MRTSVLVVREHGAAKDRLLFGTETDFVKQKAEFKKLAASGKCHPKYEMATQYTSDGGMRRLKFISPEQAKQRAAAAARLAVQAKAEADAKAKATAKPEKPAEKPAPQE